MRDGIDTARRAHGHRQGHSQVDIVDHSPREDLRIGASLLQSVGCFTQNRGHLTACVGGRDTDVRQSCADADGFAQADGATTADGDDAVGALGFGVFQCLVGDVGGSVHGGFGEDAGHLAVQDGLDILGLGDLLRGREEERCFEVLAGELVGELLQCAATEDDSAGVGVVFEGVHGGCGGDGDGWSCG